MSATGPKTKLNQLLKSFADSSTSRSNGKTDTNKLIQLSQFIEYLQSLKSEDILSISKGLEDALLTIIIPHPQVSNLVYRDLVAQICILNFQANLSKLRDFYINLQDKLQNNRSNSLRLTVLHVMGVLAANFPVLSQFLNETCGILLKTAKSSSLSVRIAIVDALKNCVIGAQQGIKYAISDLMRLCEKIGRDRDSRVRVALSAVILLMSHYYPDHLKEYISLIRKQCTVKHHNVRHAFGDILGKILARTIPADTETAKRESRRRQQEREQLEAAQNKGKSSKGGSHVDNDIDSDEDVAAKGKSDDSSLAASIIDFESGFFAASTLFDKLRCTTSSVSKNSSWYGLTSGTQLLMSFLKECMLLSRFESTRLSYVITKILKKLKTSKYLKKERESKAKHLRNMGKMMMMKGRDIDHMDDVDDGIVSCMSYVLRFGLFKYLDESSQSKAIQILCDFITHREKKRNRQQIYLCLNEIGFILHSLQCGVDEQINDIFLMCLRFTTYTSHAIRNRAAQCLSLCAISNSDQVFVWADGLIKEISATLSTIDSSDPSKMYLLHGRSITLSLIIKIIPQLAHGVPDSVACKAFSVAVDLFNVDIQEDVSFNLEASSILTVCGWVLVDALIHLGTSWANSKIKTLLNIWRDVFSQTEFTPQTSSEAISLIYVKQAAYHSMLTFVKIFEKQIPIHPDLQTQIVKRLQHALDFEKYINSMIHDKKKPYEHVLTPAVRHQLARLRAIMMNIFSFLPPTMYERHVTLLKLANANFSHRNAVTSSELEHLLDYEDDILCYYEDNTLVSRSCCQLNIFIEYISNPTIDELGLDKSWMPQDLMHSVLFQLGIIHDENEINLHKSTRITALLADINDAAPKQIQSISPHLSYSHYTCKKRSSQIINENDIESSLKKKEMIKIKQDIKSLKLAYNESILSTLEIASTQQSMRLIPRLTMSYFEKENCDANLRLFCKLFPFQNEQHKLKLVQHFVEVAKDAKQSEKSESLKIVLSNSAAVILGCCKCMLENGIQFGKGKVRDSVLRIASDFLAFNNALVMRAGAQIFGILSRSEDAAFKTTIIQYLYKKKFGEQKSSIRAASALALGCIHQYSGSKENLGFTVAALQLLERDGNVSLWLLHSLRRILLVDDDEAICRNILGFTLSILADEKDSVDTRVLAALLQILATLLTRSVGRNMLNTIIFMLKFIERLNIACLHSKLLECCSKIAQCSPESIVNLDNTSSSSNNTDALDAQQYIIHELQRCLFSGDLREVVSAMDALQTFASHSPSILVHKNVLHSLLYLLDSNATVPIIYNRALSALSAVTSIYGQKYPQSLLAYFRTISLRGMQIKTPQISQIMSLIAQDLAIKKLTKSTNVTNNEWVIIPPSLPCLRYTSLLWIQFVTKSMIDYAVNESGCYINVKMAKNAVNSLSGDENILVNDFEYIILSVNDLVQLVCRDATSKYTIVRNKALQCLHSMIVHFSQIPDVDAGYDGEFLLNQFRAQIHPSIRGIISTECEPSIRFISPQIAVDYMNCPLSTQESIQKQFESLFKIFDDNPGKCFRHLCGVYEAHVRTQVILAHLTAISTLYNRVYSGDKVPFSKILKTLFIPKLAILKDLIEKALMDYVVVTSSTRKTLRDYNGNFFIGHSYRRVRQHYISSFAQLLRTLARLVSSNMFKKNVDKTQQMIESPTAITLFATSLYCLQDCLIHFDDEKQQNELPQVQNACINLLETLTTNPYLNNKAIDQDMLYDLLTMIHGGIKHQITKNTINFIWDQDLIQLLLNAAQTILNHDLYFEINMQKLLNVIVNCWIDPINILISYVTTTYDDSPFLNNIKEKKKKQVIHLDESVFTTLIQLCQAIHKYNIDKEDQEEIDYKHWALQLTDWCNVVTAISMLFSTVYLPNKSISIHLTEQHSQLLTKLLNILLQFDLYTKPDPNNPNFNLNCMRARGCIAENINYLCHSLPNGINPHQYYAYIVTMVYKLSHCRMNVEITQEKQDDDEKLNDRQSNESVENIRQFILANIHNDTNQKWIIQALSICWKQLLKEINDIQQLNKQLQRKYSSINIQIETMILILPHIIMILSANIKLYNIHFVNSLLYILDIFDIVNYTKTCKQIYNVIIPLLIKYIAHDEHNVNIKMIIIQYIAQNLTTNTNLLDAVKSLPRSIVEYLQQQLTDADHDGDKKIIKSKSNGVKKSDKEAIDGEMIVDKNGKASKKSKKKKKKGKKKKKKKKSAPTEEEEQNTIDFSAF